jgi:hypothetical protein
LPLQPQQHIDGVSLVPLLTGGRIAARPLFWHYPHYGNQGGEPSSIIQQADWKLIHYWEDQRNELYHLPTDIGEQCDLASKEAARAAQLWTALQAWLKETGARIPQPYPVYDEAWAEKHRQAARSQKARLEKEHAACLEPNWQPDPTWWKSLVPNE